MKHSVSFLLFFTSLLVAQVVLPWWSGFMVAFFWFYFWTDQRILPFLYGFAVGFLIWLCVALFREKTGTLPVSVTLSSLLGQIPVVFVFVLSGMIGGLISGTGAWLGRKARFLRIQEAAE